MRGENPVLCLSAQKKRILRMNVFPSFWLDGLSLFLLDIFVAEVFVVCRDLPSPQVLSPFRATVVDRSLLASAICCGGSGAFVSSAGGCIVFQVLSFVN